MIQLTYFRFDYNNKKIQKLKSKSLKLFFFLKKEEGLGENPAFFVGGGFTFLVG